MKEKADGEHEKLHLGPNKDRFLLRQRVVFEMAAGGMEFTAASACCLVHALQQTGASSPQTLRKPSSGRV